MSPMMPTSRVAIRSNNWIAAYIEGIRERVIVSTRRLGLGEVELFLASPYRECTDVDVDKEGALSESSCEWLVGGKVKYG